jgi:molybdopterin synthase catalytic subunit
MKLTLSHAPLSIDAVVSAVADETAGAIVIFLGVVRNHSEGRMVTRLDYPAYERMAEAELGAIAAELETELSSARVAAAHRLGSLVVGDIAVVCAASAPHRAEAFRVARLLIDRIKERVPIWKREHGPDGAAWVGWVDARCLGDEHHAHDHTHDAHSGKL